MATNGPKKFNKTLLNRIKDLFSDDYDFIFSLYYDSTPEDIKTTDEIRSKILTQVDSLIAGLPDGKKTIESPELEKLLSDFKANSSIQKRVNTSSEKSSTNINGALELLLNSYDYFSKKIFPYQSRDVATGARVILDSAPETEKKNFEKLTAYAILARQSLKGQEPTKSEVQTLKSVFGTTKVEKSPKEIFDGFNETFEEIKKSPVVATYLKTKDIQHPGLHKRHIPSIIIGLGVFTILGALSVLGGLPPSSPSFSSVIQFLAQQSLPTALGFAALPVLGFTGYKFSQHIATRKLRKLLKSGDLTYEQKKELFETADKVEKKELSMDNLQDLLKEHNVKIHKSKRVSLTKYVLKDTNKGVKEDLSQYRVLKKNDKKMAKLIEKGKTTDISKKEGQIRYLSEKYKDKYLVSIFTPAYAKRVDADEKEKVEELTSYKEDSPTTEPIVESKKASKKEEGISEEDKKAISSALTSRSRKETTLKLNIAESTYEVKISKQKANAILHSAKKIFKELTAVAKEMQNNDTTESATLEYKTGIGKNSSTIRVKVTPTSRKK